MDFWKHCTRISTRDKIIRKFIILSLVDILVQCFQKSISFNNDVYILDFLSCQTSESNVSIQYLLQLCDEFDVLSFVLYLYPIKGFHSLRILHVLFLFITCISQFPSLLPFYAIILVYCISFRICKAKFCCELLIQRHFVFLKCILFFLYNNITKVMKD